VLQGAGLLRVSVNPTSDAAHVPCRRGEDSRTRQGFSPARGSANVEGSEIPNLGTDVGKLGPTGESNSGQVIYLGGNRDGERRVGKKTVKA